MMTVEDARVAWSFSRGERESGDVRTGRKEEKR